MSATVVLSESNGVAENVTDDISNVNFGSDDSPNLDPAIYPITAQADGHGYEKWLRFKVTALGDASKVDNLKVWLSDLGGGWLLDEGISCSLKIKNYSAPSYPGGGPVQTDSAVATGKMPESEPPNANVGIGGSLYGSITTVPAYSDYFVLQMDVTERTPTGNVNQKTLTHQWDEQ